MDCPACDFTHPVGVWLDGPLETMDDIAEAIRDSAERSAESMGWRGGYCLEHAPAAAKAAHEETQAAIARELDGGQL